MFQLRVKHVSQALDACGLEAAHKDSIFADWSQGERKEFRECLFDSLHTELTEDEFWEWVDEDEFPEEISLILEHLAVDQAKGNHADEMGEQSRF